MDVSNSSDLKKKIFSWWGLALFLGIFGYQFGGIGGVVGGTVIYYGLQRTIQSSKYSKSQKIVYSIFYCAGGIVISLIIATGLTVAIQKFFGPNIFAKPDIEKNYQIPTGFQKFKSTKTEFSALAYPNDWTVRQGDDQYETVFESPDKGSLITATLIFMDEKNIDLKTSIANDTQRAIQEYPEIKWQKLSEENKVINNRDWYIYDTTVDFGDSIMYHRTGNFLTGKYDNRQYISFDLVSSDKDTFPRDTKIFDTMIESVRLFK